MKNLFLLIAALFVFKTNTFSQSVLLEKTSIQGRVIDNRNEEGLAYVTLQFNDGASMALSDIDGFFKIETTKKPTLLKVSYLGYETESLRIIDLQKRDVKIRLKEIETALSEITVRPDKYSRKNNPAVDLVAKVFEHKDANRKEGLDHYQFEKYEKLRMDLNGITDKFKSKWYFNRFQFVFDFCDSNEINNRIALPFYLRERFSQSFYRKSPKGKKEKVFGERQYSFDSEYNVDEDGISAQLSALYSDIDIYDGAIKLIDKEFIGPLASNANSFYRFYIIDTSVFDDEKFANVFFAPKNKGDLAFTGQMQVTLDGSYAVRAIDMGITKDINLNFVNDMRVQQWFDFAADSASGGRRLLLNREEISMDFKVLRFKEGRSLLTHKTAYYQNYLLNHSQPDSLFSGKELVVRDTGNIKKRDSLFWQKKRLVDLETPEADIDKMYRQVQDSKTFKRVAGVAAFLGTGYQKFGPVELGELGNFYSFNDVEGNRFRGTLRTNRKFSQRVRLSSYAAFGDLDRKWKGGGSAIFALPKARYNRFPTNQFRLSYEHDLRIAGLSSSAEPATIASSFQRGTTDRMLLNRIARIQYERETKQNFGFSINFQRKEVTATGALAAEPSSPVYADVIATELGGHIRWAPNETFYQSESRRFTVNNRWPVFLFQAKIGFKNLLGGQQAYQRASLRMDKIFYLKQLGKTFLNAETGAIRGSLSYPLLELHEANQGFFFSPQAFNMMNYLEFVSDRWATLHVSHDFGGLVLNRIPLLKRLKLREAGSFKMLLGRLSESNIPTAANGLLPLPTDPTTKLPTTFGLAAEPYMEASAGIANIFGFLRLDYVWRLSYLENPGVSRGGPRLSFGIGF